MTEPKQNAYHLCDECANPGCSLVGHPVTKECGRFVKDAPATDDLEADAKRDMGPIGEMRDFEEEHALDPQLDKRGPHDDF